MVGVTVLLALAGLVFLLLIFGYLPRVLQTGYHVQIELDDAASVNPGSRVNLAGIDVGEVETIAFRQPFDGGVLVKARIKDTVDIPTSARVVVERELLGGSSTLKFVVNRNGGAIGDFLTRDGGAKVMGGAGTLDSAFDGFQQMGRDFGQMGEDFARLSDEWSGVGAKVNAFLAGETSAQTPGPLGAAVRVVTQMEERLVQVESMVAGLDRLVNDPQLREDIAATGVNARKLTADASAGLAQAARSVEEVKARALAAVDDMADVLSEAQAMVAKANRGQGTLGKTLNDPALYDNFNDAVLRIGTAADRLSLLLDKWKAEGVPISF